MAQTLSYQSRPTNRPPRNGRAASCLGLLIGLQIATNGILVARAAADRSWGALYIMLVVGPIANGLIMLVSLALIPLVRHLSRGAVVKPYVFTALLGPIAGIVMDGAIIMGIGLHGC